MTLTAERVRQAFDYATEAGLLTWRIGGGKRRIGQLAGGIHSNGRGKHYLQVVLDAKFYLAHRLAWLHVYGRWPRDEIDHLDGNGLNNKLNNLREVPRGQNAKNARLPITNTSGFIGVSKSGRKWRAHVSINDQHKYLGTFTDKSDAAKVAKKARKENGFHPNHGTKRPL